jgi:RNA polymerase primary sigma factor
MEEDWDGDLDAELEAEGCVAVGERPASRWERGAPRLTAAEEVRLARSARSGDAKAREQLIEANVPLVVGIARRYRCEGMEFEDLVQEGILGLIAAVDRFDPDRGCRFGTYATHWIRQAIGRAVLYQGHLIRLPDHVAVTAPKVEGWREVLSHRLGRAPSVAELAAETGVPAGRVALALRRPKEPLSLDVDVRDLEETTLGDLLVDARAPDPEACAIAGEERAAMQALLRVLRPRERQVIELRFGLVDGSERTLLEVAETLHTSREGARQIEQRALGKLREAAADKEKDEPSHPRMNTNGHE